MPEPITLLEEVSPLGNVMAKVVDDGRVVSFYLFFHPSGVRMCWVRNRLPGLDRDEAEVLREGRAPLMPRSKCLHPNGAPALEKGVLQILWFEEGNGAALLEKDEILAIIPPWSGQGGFDGYARDCSHESIMAWPLTKDNFLHERLQAAQEYWRLYDDPMFWQNFRQSLIVPLQTVLGQQSKYYIIDDDKWPPKALLRFDLPDRYIMVTVGVSLVPQPNVESSVREPSQYRRFEMAAAIDKRCPAEQLTRLGQYISAQTRHPWTCWSWFGEGHTLPCDSTPDYCGGHRFPAVLLSGRFPGTPKIDWPKFRGDTINLLWIVPISERERQKAMEWDRLRANAMEYASWELIEFMIAAGIGVTMQPRKELSFGS